MGYLWADGSVFRDARGQAYIRLFIKESDALNIMPYFDHFNYHKKWVHYRYHYKSKARNNSPKIQFALYNKALGEFLLDDLEYSGKSRVAPNKILTYVPKMFHQHFWRGYFDGDGCITLPKHHRLSIASTYEQDWSAVQTLMKSLGCKATVRHKIHKKLGHKSSIIDVSRLKDIVMFCRFLYKSYNDDNIGLRRKYDRYLGIEKKYNETVALKSSRHIGVTYNKRSNKWRAYYGHNGVNKYLGGYGTEKEAVTARRREEEIHEHNTCWG